MPIVLENLNQDEAIARIVFDKDLFTLFYRRLVCSAGASKGEEFLSIINEEVPELAHYNPVIIEQHTESRHRHFKPRDTQLSHVHLGFDKSIENANSVKLLIKVIDNLQSKYGDTWQKIKYIKDENFGESSCAAVLFTRKQGLVDATQKYLEQNRLYLTTPLPCLWTKSKMPIQEIECDTLPDVIPTYQEIQSEMKMIMDLFNHQQLRKNKDIADNESSSFDDNSMQGMLFTCIIGLIITSIIVAPVVRTVRRML
jgi:hypothetical protein